MVGECCASGVRRIASASPLAVAFFSFPPAVLAQGEFWSFQIGATRSDVSIGDSEVAWDTDRAQLTYQNPATGGFYFAFEVQQRDRLVDHVFIGAAYKRFGEWTINGRAGFAADPEFYYRYMAEGALSRRLVGGLVGTVAYRYVNFTSTEVRIVSPGATYYFAKGEIGGQVNVARNQALEVNSSSYVIRGIWFAAPRFRLSGGLAVGERIFDITSLVNEPAEGWLTFVDLRFRITLKNQVGVVIDFARGL